MSQIFGFILSGIGILGFLVAFCIYVPAVFAFFISRIGIELVMFAFICIAGVGGAMLQ